MTNDLALAAERRRKHHSAGGVSVDSPYYEQHAEDHRWPYTRQLEVDAWTLADAYLASVRPDSELPLTEEWLRSVGFKSADGGDGPLLFGFTIDRGVVLQIQPSDECILTLACRAITRAGVRDLCRVLGIVLNDPKE